MALPGWVKWLRKYKGLLFLILYPILLCPLLIVYPQEESKGAYTLLLMAGYWITEVIPIYVTALLPLVMAPLMGLFTSNEACIEYMRVSSSFLIQFVFNLISLMLMESFFYFKIRTRLCCSSTAPSSPLQQNTVMSIVVLALQSCRLWVETPGCTFYRF